MSARHLSPQPCSWRTPALSVPHCPACCALCPWEGLVQGIWDSPDKCSQDQSSWESSGLAEHNFFPSAACAMWQEPCLGAQAGRGRAAGVGLLWQALEMPALVGTVKPPRLGSSAANYFCNAPQGSCLGCVLGLWAGLGARTEGSMQGRAGSLGWFFFASIGAGL